MKTYISLTTVPERIKNWNSFQENLKSLVNQKTLVDYQVILTIPEHYAIKNEPYEIHSDLANFIEDNPKIILNRKTIDYGPITKVIGALSISTDPNDTLIVCDDDHKYNEGMIDYHLKMQDKYNSKAVICFRGDIPAEKVPVNPETEDKRYYLRPCHTYFPVREDFRLIIPGHWHSVSYKRGYFGEDFLDPNFLSLGDNDDLLIAYYFKKKRKPIICANWENETDYTPVNDNGRASWSFPIDWALSHYASGFDEFRKITKDQNGRLTKELFDFITDNSIIYEE